MWGVPVSDCHGDLAVASKVDRNMLDYIDSEANEYGLTRAEFLRRLLDFYRESRREKLDCPHCGETIVADLGES